MSYTIGQIITATPPQPAFGADCKPVWHCLIPKPTPQAHEEGRAFFRAGNVSKKVAGLLYAGDSTIPGIGMPMCLISAELVIKRLRGDTPTEPMPEPLQPSAR